MGMGERELKVKRAGESGKGWKVEKERMKGGEDVGNIREGRLIF
jgi:hypothetical protein